LWPVGSAAKLSRRGGQNDGNTLARKKRNNGLIDKEGGREKRDVKEGGVWEKKQLKSLFSYTKGAAKEACENQRKKGVAKCNGVFVGGGERQLRTSVQRDKRGGNIRNAETAPGEEGSSI